jgi:hypothetical protein
LILFLRILILSLISLTLFALELGEIFVLFAFILSFLFKELLSLSPLIYFFVVDNLFEKILVNFYYRIPPIYSISPV